MMQMTSAMEDQEGGTVVKRLSVPIGLEELMNGLTKEVLMKQPKDIYNFASEHFAKLLALRDKGEYQQPPSKSITFADRDTFKDLVVSGKQCRLSRQVSIRAASPSGRMQIKRSSTPKGGATPKRQGSKGLQPIKEDSFRKATRMQSWQKRSKADSESGKRSSSEDSERKKRDDAGKKIKQDRGGSLKDKKEDENAKKQKSSCSKDNGESKDVKRVKIQDRGLQHSGELHDTVIYEEAEKRENTKEKNVEELEKEPEKFIPKSSSVEEGEPGVKDGRLTVTPPKIIKQTRVDSGSDLTLVVPVVTPQQTIKSDDANNGTAKDEPKSKAGDETKKQNGYDPEALRQELRNVEEESKLATFKTSYNPYVLRQEIKNASKELPDEDAARNESLEAESQESGKKESLQLQHSSEHHDTAIQENIQDLENAKKELIDKKEENATNETEKETQDLEKTESKLELQHSSEFHDTAIQENNQDLKREQDAKTELINKKAENATNVTEQETKNPEKNESKLELQHSSELHDTLIQESSQELKKDEAENKGGEENVSNGKQGSAAETAEVEKKESKLELQHSSEFHDTASQIQSSQDSKRGEDTVKESEKPSITLQHSGEFHDSLLADVLDKEEKADSDELQVPPKVQVESIGDKEKDSLDVKESEQEDSITREQAATTIQAGVRGYLTRKHKLTARSAKDLPVAKIDTRSKVTNFPRSKTMLGLELERTQLPSFTKSMSFTDSAFSRTMEEDEEKSHDYVEDSDTEDLGIESEKSALFSEKTLAEEALVHSGEFHDAIIPKEAIKEDEVASKSLGLVESTPSKSSTKDLEALKDLHHTGEFHDIVVIKEAEKEKDDKKTGFQHTGEFHDVIICKEAEKIEKDEKAELQHTGEFHDAVVFREPEKVKEDVKTSIQSTSEVTDTVITEETKEEKDSQEGDLQHTSELHDVIIPAESSQKDEKQSSISESQTDKEKQTLVNTESQKEFMQHSSEMHDLVNLTIKDESEETNAEKENLLHTSELHDVVVLKEPQSVKEEIASSENNLKKDEKLDQTEESKDVEKKGLQHSGGLHDLVIPEPVLMKNEQKLIQSELKTDEKETEKELQHTSEMHDALVLDTKKKEDAQDSKQKQDLQHTSEMHDLVLGSESVIPEPITKDTNRNESGSKDSKNNESKNLEHTSELHDSVIPTTSAKDDIKDDAKKISGLEHSSEMHDVVIPKEAIKENIQESISTKHEKQSSGSDSKEQEETTEIESKDSGEKELQLQHSSELHDMFIPTESLSVEEDGKLIDSKVQTNETEKQDLQHTSELHDLVITGETDKKEETSNRDGFEKDEDQEKNHLQHSSEMHDLVIPTETNENEEINKNDEKALQHSGEMHDSIILIEPIRELSKIDLKNEELRSDEGLKDSTGSVPAEDLKKLNNDAIAKETKEEKKDLQDTSVIHDLVVPTDSNLNKTEKEELKGEHKITASTSSGLKEPVLVKDEKELLKCWPEETKESKDSKKITEDEEVDEIKKDNDLEKRDLHTSGTQDSIIPKEVVLQEKKDKENATDPQNDKNLENGEITFEKKDPAENKLDKDERIIGDMKNDKDKEKNSDDSTYSEKAKAEDKNLLHTSEIHDLVVSSKDISDEKDGKLKNNDLHNKQEAEKSDKQLKEELNKKDLQHVSELNDVVVEEPISIKEGKELSKTNFTQDKETGEMKDNKHPEKINLQHSSEMHDIVPTEPVTEKEKTINEKENNGNPNKVKDEENLKKSELEHSGELHDLVLTQIFTSGDKEMHITDSKKDETKDQNDGGLDGTVLNKNEEIKETQNTAVNSDLAQDAIDIVLGNNQVNHGISKTNEAVEVSKNEETVKNKEDEMKEQAAKGNLENNPALINGEEPNQSLKNEEEKQEKKMENKESSETKTDLKEEKPIPIPGEKDMKKKEPISIKTENELKETGLEMKQSAENKHLQNTSDIHNNITIAAEDDKELIKKGTTHDENLKEKEEKHKVNLPQDTKVIESTQEKHLPAEEKTDHEKNEAVVNLKDVQESKKNDLQCNVESLPGDTHIKDEDDANKTVLTENQKDKEIPNASLSQGNSQDIEKVDYIDSEMNNPAESVKNEQELVERNLADEKAEQVMDNKTMVKAGMQQKDIQVKDAEKTSLENTCDIHNVTVTEPASAKETNISQEANKEVKNESTTEKTPKDAKDVKDLALDKEPVSQEELSNALKTEKSDTNGLNKTGLQHSSELHDLVVSLEQEIITKEANAQMQEDKDGREKHAGDPNIVQKEKETKKDDQIQQLAKKEEEISSTDKKVAKDANHINLKDEASSGLPDKELDDKSELKTETLAETNIKNMTTSEDSSSIKKDSGNDEADRHKQDLEISKELQDTQIADELLRAHDENDLKENVTVDEDLKPTVEKEPIKDEKGVSDKETLIDDQRRSEFKDSTESECKDSVIISDASDSKENTTELPCISSAKDVMISEKQAAIQEEKSDKVLTTKDDITDEKAEAKEAHNLQHTGEFHDPMTLANENTNVPLNANSTDKEGKNINLENESSNERDKINSEVLKDQHEERPNDKKEDSIGSTEDKLVKQECIKLQHSGEMHDSIIIPENDGVSSENIPTPLLDHHNLSAADASSGIGQEASGEAHGGAKQLDVDNKKETQEQGSVNQVQTVEVGAMKCSESNNSLNKPPSSLVPVELAEERQKPVNSENDGKLSSTAHFDTMKSIEHFLSTEISHYGLPPTPKTTSQNKSELAVESQEAKHLTEDKHNKNGIFHVDVLDGAKRAVDKADTKREGDKSNQSEQKESKSLNQEQNDGGTKTRTNHKSVTNEANVLEEVEIETNDNKLGKPEPQEFKIFEERSDSSKSNEDQKDVGVLDDIKVLKEVEIKKLDESQSLNQANGDGTKTCTDHKSVTDGTKPQEEIKTETKDKSTKPEPGESNNLEETSGSSKTNTDFKNRSVLDNTQVLKEVEIKKLEYKSLDQVESDGTKTNRKSITDGTKPLEEVKNKTNEKSSESQPGESKNLEGIRDHTKTNADHKRISVANDVKVLKEVEIKKLEESKSLDQGKSNDIETNTDHKDVSVIDDSKAVKELTTKEHDNESIKVKPHEPKSSQETGDDTKINTDIKNITQAVNDGKKVVGEIEAKKHENELLQNATEPKLIHNLGTSTVANIRENNDEGQNSLKISTTETNKLTKEAEITSHGDNANKQNAEPQLAINTDYKDATNVVDAIKGAKEVKINEYDQASKLELQESKVSQEKSDDAKMDTDHKDITDATDGVKKVLEEAEKQKDEPNKLLKNETEPQEMKNVDKFNTSENIKENNYEAQDSLQLDVIETKNITEIKSHRDSSSKPKGELEFPLNVALEDNITKVELKDDESEKNSEPVQQVITGKTEKSDQQISLEKQDEDQVGNINVEDHKGKQIEPKTTPPAQEVISGTNTLQQQTSTKPNDDQTKNGRKTKSQETTTNNKEGIHKLKEEHLRKKDSTAVKKDEKSRKVRKNEEGSIPPVSKDTRAHKQKEEKFNKEHTDSVEQKNKVQTRSEKRAKSQENSKLEDKIKYKQKSEHKKEDLSTRKRFSRTASESVIIETEKTTQKTCTIMNSKTSTKRRTLQRGQSFDVPKVDLNEQSDVKNIKTAQKESINKADKAKKKEFKRKPSKDNNEYSKDSKGTPTASNEIPANKAALSKTPVTDEERPPANALAHDSPKVNGSATSENTPCNNIHIPADLHKQPDLSDSEKNIKLHSRGDERAEVQQNNQDIDAQKSSEKKQIGNENEQILGENDKISSEDEEVKSINMGKYGHVHEDERPISKASNTSTDSTATVIAISPRNSDIDLKSDTGSQSLSSEKSAIEPELSQHSQENGDVENKQKDINSSGKSEEEKVLTLNYIEGELGSKEETVLAPRKDIVSQSFSSDKSTLGSQSLSSQEEDQVEIKKKELDVKQHTSEMTEHRETEEKPSPVKEKEKDVVTEQRGTEEAKVSKFDISKLREETEDAGKFKETLIQNPAEFCLKIESESEERFQNTTNGNVTATVHKNNHDLDKRVMATTISEDIQDLMKDTAATTIQKNYRGYRVRRDATNQNSCVQKKSELEQPGDTSVKLEDEESSVIEKQEDMKKSDKLQQNNHLNKEEISILKPQEGVHESTALKESADDILATNNSIEVSRSEEISKSDNSKTDTLKDTFKEGSDEGTILGNKEDNSSTVNILMVHQDVKEADKLKQHTEDALATLQTERLSNETKSVEASHSTDTLDVLKTEQTILEADVVKKQLDNVHTKIDNKEDKSSVVNSSKSHGKSESNIQIDTENAVSSSELTSEISSVKEFLSAEKTVNIGSTTSTMLDSSIKEEGEKSSIQSSSKLHMNGKEYGENTATDIQKEKPNQDALIITNSVKISPQNLQNTSSDHQRIDAKNDTKRITMDSSNIHESTNKQDKDSFNKKDNLKEFKNPYLHATAPSLDILDDHQPTSLESNVNEESMSEGQYSSRRYDVVDSTSPRVHVKATTPVHQALGTVLEQQLAITAPHAKDKQKNIETNPEYIYIPLKEPESKSLKLSDEVSLENQDKIGKVNVKIQEKNIDEQKGAMTADFDSSKYDLVEPPGTQKRTEKRGSVSEALDTVLEQQLAIATPRAKEKGRDAETPEYIYIPLKDPELRNETNTSMDVKDSVSQTTNQSLIQKTDDAAARSEHSGDIKEKQPETNMLKTGDIKEENTVLGKKNEDVKVNMEEPIITKETKNVSQSSKPKVELILEKPEEKNKDIKTASTTSDNANSLKSVDDYDTSKYDLVDDASPRISKPKTGAVPKVLGEVLDQTLAITTPKAIIHGKDTKPDPEYIYIPLKDSNDSDTSKAAQDSINSTKESSNVKDTTLQPKEDAIKLIHEQHFLESSSSISTTGTDEQELKREKDVPIEKKSTQAADEDSKTLTQQTDSFDSNTASVNTKGTSSSQANIDGKDTKPDPEYMYIPLKDSNDSDISKEAQDSTNSTKESSNVKETTLQPKEDAIKLIHEQHFLESSSSISTTGTYEQELKSEKDVPIEKKSTQAADKDSKTLTQQTDSFDSNTDSVNTKGTSSSQPAFDSGIESSHQMNVSSQQLSTPSEFYINIQSPSPTPSVISVQSSTPSPYKINTQTGASVPSENNSTSPYGIWTESQGEEASTIRSQGSPEPADGRIIRRVDRSAQSEDGPLIIQTTQLSEGVNPVAVQLNQPPAGAALTLPRRAQARDGDASRKAGTTRGAHFPTSMETGKRQNAAVDNKNMEEVAATKIQASFRGYQVRKHLKSKNGGADAISHKRSLRRKSSGKLRGSEKASDTGKKPSDLEEKSATKIQAGIRGFLVRRRQQKKPKTTPESY